MKLDLSNLHPAVADVLKARMWSMRFDHHARPEDAGLRTVLAKRRHLLTAHYKSTRE